MVPEHFSDLSSGAPVSLTGFVVLGCLWGFGGLAGLAVAIPMLGCVNRLLSRVNLPLACRLDHRYSGCDLRGWYDLRYWGGRG